MYEKWYILITSTYICKCGTYLESIIDDSVITFDEIIEETRTSNIFQRKKVTSKTKNLYTLLSFSLIATALLITVKLLKRFSPYYKTNNELKEIDINDTI